MRAIYAGTASLRERRGLTENVTANFPTCPIPEVARLARASTPSDQDDMVGLTQQAAAN